MCAFYWISPQKQALDWIGTVGHAGLQKREEITGAKYLAGVWCPREQMANTRTAMITNHCSAHSQTVKFNFRLSMRLRK